MGFELDEIIYNKVLKYFKNKRLNDVELLSRQINLSDIKPRLTLFARAISGAPIEIFPAEREGGYKNKSFFLPISSTLFPTKQENLKFYFFRIVYLSVQKQLNLNWENQEQTHQHSLEKAVETAPLVLTKMFQNFPSMQEFYYDAVPKLPVNKKDQTIECVISTE